MTTGGIDSVSVRAFAGATTWDDAVPAQRAIITEDLNTAGVVGIDPDAQPGGPVNGPGVQISNALQEAHEDIVGGRLAKSWRIVSPVEGGEDAGTVELDPSGHLIIAIPGSGSRTIPFELVTFVYTAIQVVLGLQVEAP